VNFNCTSEPFTTFNSSGPGGVAGYVHFSVGGSGSPLLPTSPVALELVVPPVLLVLVPLVPLVLSPAPPIVST
jgi:hypothetical protein